MILSRLFWETVDTEAQKTEKNLGKFILERETVPGSALFPEITHLPDLFAWQSKLYQQFPLLTFQWIAFLPFETQAPIPLLFSVWYISLSCRAAFWVSFLCGAPTWSYAFKVVLFFLLLIFNYGRAEGCLSREPSRVEGKIFFLLYGIKRNV